MSLFFSLIVGGVLQAAQYAPADVPRDHWAFPAVNEMFKQGLLKGYPADAPDQLPKKLEHTNLMRFARLAVKAGVQPPLTTSETRYDYAVLAHDTVWHMTNASHDVILRHRPLLLQLEHVLHELQKELQDMDADIERINQLASSLTARAQRLSAKFNR